MVHNCNNYYDNIIANHNLISKTIKDWKEKLESGWQTLTQVEIERDIFKGDPLPPLLSVMGMMPLNYILKKNEQQVTHVKSPRKR